MYNILYEMSCQFRFDARYWIRTGCAGRRRAIPTDKEKPMDVWFTIDQVDESTYIISEYRHWEETHCYLLIGNDQALLIDTGLGVYNISDPVRKLTNKPVAAVATHIHWDHIGSHKYFLDFYAHEAELNWLNCGFPLPVQAVKNTICSISITLLREA